MPYLDRQAKAAYVVAAGALLISVGIFRGIRTFQSKGGAVVAKLRVEGEHFTYLRVWQTSKHLLAAGLEREQGSYYPLLAASVFAFFAFEGFVNELGRQIAPDVWTDERAFFARGEFRGTLGKFKYLAQLCDFHYNAGTRPFQTVRMLARARDVLVHNKTETFDLEVPAGAFADAEVPSPTMNEYADRDFASRAVVDVERLCDDLIASAKLKFGEFEVGYRHRAFDGISGTHSKSLI